MEQIKNTVQALLSDLRKKREQKPLFEREPDEFLKKFFSKKEIDHIGFGYFKKGVLCIKVDSSSWLYHLNLKKELITGELKKNHSAIKEIKFYIGEV